VWMYRGRTVSPIPQKPVEVAAPVPSAPPAAAPTPAASDDAVELAFWNSIGSSSDPRLYREYLAKYPQGKFASLAKLKLQEAPAKTADAPRPPAPAPPPEKAVQPSTASLPPLRPMLKPEEYSGPLRGNLVWTGKLGPDATLTIQGGKAIAGSLLGDLPRVPVTVEQPSAANQFDRVVVRNASSTEIRSMLIRWRVAK
jgi:hypothetical protein